MKKTLTGFAFALAMLLAFGGGTVFSYSHHAAADSTTPILAQAEEVPMGEDYDDELGDEGSEESEDNSPTMLLLTQVMEDETEDDPNSDYDEEGDADNATID